MAQKHAERHGIKLWHKGTYRSYAKVPNLDLQICSQEQIQALEVTVQHTVSMHVLEAKCSLQAAVMCQLCSVLVYHMQAHTCIRTLQHRSSGILPLCLLIKSRTLPENANSLSLVILLLDIAVLTNVRGLPLLAYSVTTYRSP